MMNQNNKSTPFDAYNASVPTNNYLPAGSTNSDRPITHWPTVSTPYDNANNQQQDQPVTHWPTVQTPINNNSTGYDPYANNKEFPQDHTHTLHSTPSAQSYQHAHHPKYTDADIKEGIEIESIKPKYTDADITENVVIELKPEIPRQRWNDGQTVEKQTMYGATTTTTTTTLPAQNFYCENNESHPEHRVTLTEKLGTIKNDITHSLSDTLHVIGHGYHDARHTYKETPTKDHVSDVKHSLHVVGNELLDHAHVAKDQVAQSIAKRQSRKNETRRAK